MDSGAFMLSEAPVKRSDQVVEERWRDHGERRFLVTNSPGLRQWMVLSGITQAAVKTFLHRFA